MTRDEYKAKLEEQYAGHKNQSTIVRNLLNVFDKKSQQEDEVDTTVVAKAAAVESTPSELEDESEELEDESEELEEKKSDESSDETQGSVETNSEETSSEEE